MSDPESKMQCQSKKSWSRDDHCSVPFAQVVDARQARSVRFDSIVASEACRSKKSCVDTCQTSEKEGSNMKEKARELISVGSPIT